MKHLRAPFRGVARRTAWLCTTAWARYGPRLMQGVRTLCFRDNLGRGAGGWGSERFEDPSAAPGSPQGVPSLFLWPILTEPDAGDGHRPAQAAGSLSGPCRRRSRLATGAQRVARRSGWRQIPARATRGPAALGATGDRRPAHPPSPRTPPYPPDGRQLYFAAAHMRRGPQNRKKYPFLWAALRGHFYLLT